jgi:hypothetical protein
MPFGGGTISLCRLFWRVLLITVILMPLWWLVWAPIATAIGFLAARRPRFFEGDWDRSSYEEACVRYQHWPCIRGVRILPAWVFLVGLFLWDVLIRNPHHVRYVAGILGIIVAAAVVLSIIFGAIPAVKNKVLATEPGRLAKDWVKAKKSRVCPLYKVV